MFKSVWLDEWFDVSKQLPRFGFWRNIYTQVTQAHYERSAYISLFFFAYIMSRQNIRVCMENATEAL